jgi:kinetochore protein Spc7/SPC105
LKLHDKFLTFVQDAKVLEDIMAIADDVIPALQQEYDAIVQDLEKETAEVAEIEASDQDYLNELKASIAEQK